MTTEKTSNSDKNPKKSNSAIRYESGAKNRQRDLFARGVAEHGDKTRARREAHYKQSNNEYTLACRLAEEEDVKNAIAYYSRQNAQKLDLRAEAVLGEIHALAFSDITEIFTFNEDKQTLDMKDVTKLPKHVKASIKSISAIRRTYYDKSLEQEVTEIAYKVELHNKWAALKHIADITKQLKPLIEQRHGTEKDKKKVVLDIRRN